MLNSKSCDNTFRSAEKRRVGRKSSGRLKTRRLRRKLYRGGRGDGDPRLTTDTETLSELLSTSTGNLRTVTASDEDDEDAWTSCDTSDTLGGGGKKTREEEGDFTSTTTTSKNTGAAVRRRLAMRRAGEVCEQLFPSEAHLLTLSSTTCRTSSTSSCQFRKSSHLKSRCGGDDLRIPHHSRPIVPSKASTSSGRQQTTKISQVSRRSSSIRGGGASTTTSDSKEGESPPPTQSQLRGQSNGGKSRRQSSAKRANRFFNNLIRRYRSDGASGKQDKSKAADSSSSPPTTTGTKSDEIPPTPKLQRRIEQTKEEYRNESFIADSAAASPALNQQFRLIREKLSEEYNGLKQRNDCLRETYANLLAMNRRYKTSLADYEQRNTRLMSDNSDHLQSSMRHRFLKLETGDLTKKTDAVKKKLTEKADIISQFQKRYNSMKAVKDSLEKEREEAHLEATHRMAKLDELSELCQGLDLMKDEELQRKLYFEKLQRAEGKVRVILRVKPTNEASCISYLSVDKVMLSNGAAGRRSGLLGGASGGAKSNQNNSKVFHFSRVFQPAATQADVYEELVTLVDSVVDGFNACVLTYGQTGSGKTHTLIGGSGEEAGEEAGAAGGIAQRACQQLLTYAQREAGRWRYTMRLSAVEIYSDRVYDLLRNGAEVRIDDDGRRVVLRNTEERPVSSPRDISECLATAQQLRRTAQSSLNVDSSRSHLLLVVRLDGQNRHNARRSQGALVLCDTAGFESQHGAWTARRQKAAREEKAIQSGLATLGDVFAALQRPSGSGRRVPYGKALLTRILKPCLAGDGRCCLIVNCWSDADQYPLTAQSLQFGAAALNRPLIQSQRTVQGAEWDWGVKA